MGPVYSTSARARANWPSSAGRDLAVGGAEAAGATSPRLGDGVAEVEPLQVRGEGGDDLRAFAVERQPADADAQAEVVVALRCAAFRRASMARLGRADEGVPPDAGVGRAGVADADGRASSCVSWPRPPACAATASGRCRACSCTRSLLCVVGHAGGGVAAAGDEDLLGAVELALRRTGAGCDRRRGGAAPRWAQDRSAGSIRFSSLVHCTGSQWKATRLPLALEPLGDLLLQLLRLERGQLDGGEALVGEDVRRGRRAGSRRR